MDCQQIAFFVASILKMCKLLFDDSCAVPYATSALRLVDSLRVLELVDWNVQIDAVTEISTVFLVLIHEGHAHTRAR